MLKISGVIPISIYPFFWVVAIGIGWLSSMTFQGTLVWVGVITCSILIHEYGHALTALAFGQKAHIELIGFGGVTQRSGTKLKPWQEFVIILNGPLAGFLFCGLAWWGHRVLNVTAPHSLPAYIMTVAFYINLFWTIMNLLPVQPLDGGKLLSIVLEALFGLRGTKAALFISLFLSAVLGLLFFAAQEFLIGSLFFLMTYESYRLWKSSLDLTEQDQNFVIQHLLKEAELDIQANRKEDALNKLQQIRELAQAGVLYLMATENAADLLMEKGDFQEAYALLEPLGSKLSPKGLRLLHRLAYQKGYWKEAISLGDRAYQYQPHYEVAIINAICHSLLGQVRPAIGWLKCAVREGVPNMQEILTKREFDQIRQDPLFQQFAHQIG